MNILIAGGAGFIGSHLCERLLVDGHRVVCLDNFITGSHANIAPLMSHDAFTLVEHNISTPYMCDPAKLRFDWVLNFASPASPIDYLEHPIPTLKVGALGTHNALGIAKAHGAAMFLASTSEIYGDPQVHPQPESYWGHVHTVGPRGVYDEAKRFAEAMTMAYHRYHGLNTRIIRIFNTYGPRMRMNDGRAIPAFCSQALRGEPITVFGTGDQTRSFCYIDDLVEGIVRLISVEYADPVNLGNPEEYTILQLAEQIIAATQSKSTIVHKDLPVDDPKQRRPDISLAKRIFDWEPHISVQDGLARTLKYFSQQLQQGETTS
jgi:dTDP-glucose 4,6-dehydratase